MVGSDVDGVHDATDLGVALHKAVTQEAALVYNARAHAVAGDPRNGGG